MSTPEIRAELAHSLARTHRRQLVAISVALAVMMVAIWSQSYNGREQVVAFQRQGCERGAANLAATVNEYRIEQAGNAAVAGARGVPGQVRRARRSTVALQEAGIRVLDSHIDRGVWPALHDRLDRRLVRDGVDGRRPFRCDVAYPDAPLFKVAP